MKYKRPGHSGKVPVFLGDALVFPLYLLSLGSSAGIISVFVQQILASEGYAPTFHTRAMLCLGAACAYMAVQLMWMTFVQMLVPARGKTPLMTEIASHLAVIVLLPFVLHIQVNWPDPLLERVEPLVYLTAFGVLHCVLKLATFYGALRSESAARWLAFLWLGAASVCAFGTWWALVQWQERFEFARPTTAAAEETYRIGKSYASASVLTEGSQVSFNISNYEGRRLTFRWGALPGSNENSQVSGTVYVTTVFEGDQTKQETRSISITQSGWAEMRISDSDIPENATKLDLIWNASRPPGWRDLVGIRPIKTSSKKVLFSGPFEHETRHDGSKPNFVVVFVDGLSSDRLSVLGHEPKVTTAFDKLAQVGLFFPNAFTPSPETPAAAMTLLTARNPLAHGILGDHNEPVMSIIETLPEILNENHYKTIAFVESPYEGYDGLDYAVGFGRGFEIYNTGLPSDCAATLAAAQSWIDARATEKLMVFIRLSELQSPRANPNYRSMTDDEESTPTQKDLHDSALEYVDRQLGAFVKHIRDYSTRNNTVVIIASPYGYTFPKGGGQKPTIDLLNGSFRVPILLLGPGVGRGWRSQPVGLQDIAPTILYLAKADFANNVEGINLLDRGAGRQPVSMFGDPLALTLRTSQWRFFWQTSLKPFSYAQSLGTGSRGLFKIDPETQIPENRNLASQYPDIVRSYQSTLRDLVEKSSGL